MEPADFSTLNTLFSLPADNAVKLGSPSGHVTTPFAFTPSFGGKNDIWKWLYTTQATDTVGIIHINREYRFTKSLTKEIFAEKLRQRQSILPLFSLSKQCTPHPATKGALKTLSIPPAKNSNFLLWDIETFTTFLPFIDGTRPLENIPFLSVCQVFKDKLYPADVWFNSNPSNLWDVWQVIKSQLSDLTSIVVTYSDYEWVCAEALLNVLAAQGINVEQDRAWLALRKQKSLDLYQLVLQSSKFTSLPTRSLKVVAPLYTQAPYASLNIQDGQAACAAYVKHYVNSSGRKPWYVQTQLEAYCKTDVRVMAPILQDCLNSDNSPRLPLSLAA